MNIYLEDGGQPVGPFSEEQVRAMLGSSAVSPAALAWAEGTAEWRPLNQVLSVPSPPPFRQLAPARPAVTSTMFPAERGTRLGAFLLDRLFSICALAPGITIVIMGSQDTKSPANNTMAGCGAIIAVVCFLTLIAIQISMLSRRGQTIGKRALSIRIVKFADETNPGFVRAFLLRRLIPLLCTLVPTLGSIFFLVDSCFIFRDDRRCIHDLMADTKVVIG